VLNDVSRTDIGFDSDKNAVTFLTLKTAVDLPEMSKRELADRILGEILSLRRPVSFVAENEPSRSLMQE
jgi:phosphopantothenoylcysteine decarboxylase/phosphopantothenate--cysteine ligase